MESLERIQIDFSARYQRWQEGQRWIMAGAKTGGERAAESCDLPDLGAERW